MSAIFLIKDDSYQDYKVNYSMFLDGNTQDNQSVARTSPTSCVTMFVSDERITALEAMTSR